MGGTFQIGAFPELKKLPLSTILNPLYENFPELKENIQRHLQSWKDIVFLDVFSSKSPTWVKDGLVMIGDAAHTLTPTGAIGINAGMKDAYVLAPIITEAIRTKQFSEGKLREFEVLRREKVEYLQEEQINEEKSYYTNFERYSLLETE